MIRLFQTERQTFDQLRDMICEKARSAGLVSSNGRYQTIMMDPRWARPEISAQEREGYERLFAKIHVAGVQAGYGEQGCSAFVEYWSIGFAGGGTYKKFRFGPPIDQVETVASLDEVKFDGRNSFHQRELGGGWWLQLDYWH